MPVPPQPLTASRLWVQASLIKGLQSERLKYASKSSYLKAALRNHGIKVSSFSSLALFFCTPGVCLDAVGEKTEKHLAWGKQFSTWNYNRALVGNGESRKIFSQKSDFLGLEFCILNCGCSGVGSRAVPMGERRWNLPWWRRVRTERDWEILGVGQRRITKRVTQVSIPGNRCYSWEGKAQVWSWSFWLRIWASPSLPSVSAETERSPEVFERG